MKWLKKAILQNPIVLAAPFETKLDERPTTVTILHPTGFSLDRVQQIALALLVVPSVIFFFISLFSAEWVASGICGVVIGLIGLIVWIIYLRGNMIWQVTWHADHVEVGDGRYGPLEAWSEPIANFQGLILDSGHTATTNSYTTSPRTYGLLLKHQDSSKSLLLHAAYKERIDDETIAYYAEQLGHPLLNN